MCRDSSQIKYNDSDLVRGTIVGSGPRGHHYAQWNGSGEAETGRRDRPAVTSVNFRPKMDVDGTFIRLISFFQRLLASAQEASKELHREIFRNLRRFCDASPVTHLLRLPYPRLYSTQYARVRYIKARDHFAYYQFTRISRVIA